MDRLIDRSIDRLQISARCPPPWPRWIYQKRALPLAHRQPQADDDRRGLQTDVTYIRACERLPVRALAAHRALPTCPARVSIASSGARCTASQACSIDRLPTPTSCLITVHTYPHAEQQPSPGRARQGAKAGGCVGTLRGPAAAAAVKEGQYPSHRWTLGGALSVVIDKKEGGSTPTRGAMEAPHSNGSKASASASVSASSTAAVASSSSSAAAEQSLGERVGAYLRDYFLGFVPPHIRRKGIRMPPLRVRVPKISVGWTGLLARSP